MQKVYLALIDYSDQDQSLIMQISVPDLGLYYDGAELTELGLEKVGTLVRWLDKQVEEAIKGYIEANYEIPEPTPLDIDQFDKTRQSAFFVSVAIDEAKPWYSLQRIMPAFGYALNVINVVPSVVINIVQMELGMRYSGWSKGSIKALAVAQALASNGIGLLFYIRLKSADSLKKIGRKIEGFWNGKKPIPLKNPKISAKPKSCCSSTALFLMRSSMAVGVIALEFGAAITQFGGLSAVDDQVEKVDSLISEEFFDVCMKMMLTCLTFTGLTMVGDLVAQLAADIEGGCNKKNKEKDERPLRKLSWKLSEADIPSIEKPAEEFKAAEKEAEQAAQVHTPAF